MFDLFYAKIKILYKSIFLFLVSTLTKGKQMVDILNICKINCACVGNHEFGNDIFNYNMNIINGLNKLIF